MGFALRVGEDMFGEEIRKAKKKKRKKKREKKKKEKEKVIGEGIFFLNLGYSFSNWDISFYLHEVDNKIL